MDISQLGNPRLQDAIRRNLVSFPAQAPTYRKQARTDIQWRIAVLYFVRGWTFGAIAERYGLSRARAGQIARAWRAASIKAGYIQGVPELQWDMGAQPVRTVSARDNVAFAGARPIAEARPINDRTDMNASASRTQVGFSGPTFGSQPPSPLADNAVSPG
jgi:hypothetical protein